MIDIAKGRYWDLPWSLVDGCTPCSPGCDHCWSAGIAHRFRCAPWLGGAKWFVTNNKGKFHGVIIPHPERLKIPLRRRKPTVYSIWNDWCHESVDHVFRHKMVLKAEFSEQHTILALTKRPQVMLDFWKSGIQHVPSNWWNGLTICNQTEADAKIPVFLQVPGKKFLSIEPMLGEINLSGSYHNFLEGWDTETEAEYDHRGDPYPVPVQVQTGKINAVILGGETGPGARPLHPDWVRSVRDQCQAAEVPFFFKSWGKHIPNLKDCFGKETVSPFSALAADVKRLLDGHTHDDLPWLPTDSAEKGVIGG